jgi:hypothetical protein
MLKPQEYSPSYPFDTFAERGKMCCDCFQMVYTKGWYLRFLYLGEVYILRCEHCEQIHLPMERFYKAPYKDMLLIKFINKMGYDIIEMLQKQALTN